MSEFAFQGNLKRHVVEFCNEDCPSTSIEGQKQHVERCSNFLKAADARGISWSILFLYSLQFLVKLHSVEAFCSKPVYETNKKCHIQSYHTHITCEICEKVWKKNIKSHLRTHEEGDSSLDKVKCDYEGCVLTFSKESNLLQHVKAIHLQQKPVVASRAVARHSHTSM